MREVSSLTFPQGFVESLDLDLDISGCTRYLEAVVSVALLAFLLLYYTIARSCRALGAGLRPEKDTRHSRMHAPFRYQRGFWLFAKRHSRPPSRLLERIRGYDLLGSDCSDCVVVGDGRAEIVFVDECVTPGGRYSSERWMISNMIIFCQ